MAAFPPTLNVCAGIVPTAVGARLVPVLTATGMLKVAVKSPGSVAVTVIDAVPLPTALIVINVLAQEYVATLVSDDRAA